MIFLFDIKKFICIGRIMYGYELDNNHGTTRKFKIFFVRTKTKNQTAWSMNFMFFKTWLKITIWLHKKKVKKHE